MLLHSLRSLGYFNRYPHCRCDSDAYAYMPLLEECNVLPSEQYAAAPEIFEHCQRIGRKWGLYDKALFQTSCTGLTWNDASSRWIVATDRGDTLSAQFVILATGMLHLPKLPRIPGLESFKGHQFHSSRWDYNYTATPTDAFCG